MSASNGRQQEIDWVEAARRFNEELVAPRAAELDARPDPADSFEWLFFEEAHARGMTRLELSRENGGYGADALTMCRFLLELSKGDLGIATDISNRTYVTRVFELSANEEQLQRFLPSIRDDPRFLLSVASTEPGVGSDALFPPLPPNEVRYSTTAVRKDGGWTLNGMKHFINGASHAKLIMVMAQSDPDASLSDGSTMFIIERDRPGLRIGRVHDKMGERCANNAEVILEDCWVPDENILGELNQGGAARSDAGLGLVLRRRNMYTASTALGVGEAAYDVALAWARDRVQGGRRLIEHDTVRSELIRQRMQLDIARTYIESVARGLDSGDPGITPAMFIFPKIFAGQAAIEMATLAMELHGGRGYMKEYKAEKLLRDAMQFLHAHGSDRVQLLKAARMQFDGGLAVQPPPAAETMLNSLR